MSVEASFSITLIGDSGVGKSKLVTCFFYPDRFKEPYFQTLSISASLKQIELDNKLYKMYFKDVTKMGKHILSLQVMKFDGIIFVFDITNRQSFENLNYWLSEVEKYAMRSKNFLSVLVGNKSDLESEREVEYRNAREFADSLSIPYIETSAKEGVNVEFLFVTMVAVMKKGTEMSSQPTDSVDLRVTSVSRIRGRDCCAL